MHLHLNRFLVPMVTVALLLVRIPTASGRVVLINPNPVAYFPFSGSAQDASGNGFHGTVHGATLDADRFGNPNSAYRFNAAQKHYIEVPVETDSKLDIKGAISVSVWVKPNEPLVADQSILNRSNYTSKTNFYLSLGANGLIDWECVKNFQTHPDVVASGTWTHVMVTQDGQSSSPTTNIYINGNKVSASPHQDGSPGNPASPLIIGLTNFGPVGLHAFDGVIDDIRIYDRELSEAEVDILALETCGPSVLFSMNGTQFSTGQVLEVHARLLNLCAATTVEAKFWIQAPDGTVASLFDPHTTLPLSAGLDITVPAVSYQFTGAEQTGSYTFGSRILDPVTGITLSSTLKSITFIP